MKQAVVRGDQLASLHLGHRKGSTPWEFGELNLRSTATSRVHRARDEARRRFVHAEVNLLNLSRTVLVLVAPYHAETVSKSGPYRAFEATQTVKYSILRHNPCDTHVQIFSNFIIT